MSGEKNSKKNQNSLSLGQFLHWTKQDVDFRAQCIMGALTSYAVPKMVAGLDNVCDRPRSHN